MLVRVMDAWWGVAVRGIYVHGVWAQCSLGVFSTVTGVRSLESRSSIAMVGENRLFD